MEWDPQGFTDSIPNNLDLLSPVCLLCNWRVRLVKSLGDLPPRYYNGAHSTNTAVAEDLTSTPQERLMTLTRLSEWLGQVSSHWWRASWGMLHNGRDRATIFPANFERFGLALRTEIADCRAQDMDPDVQGLFHSGRALSSFRGTGGLYLILDSQQHYSKGNRISQCIYCILGLLVVILEIFLLLFLKVPSLNCLASLPSYPANAW